MKRTTVLLAVLAFAVTAQAQHYFTPNARNDNAGVFSIGPRLSSYSTDVDIGVDTLETGRQTSFGMVGGYRAGSFVLDFLWDHDPENGIDVIDLFPGTESYSRNRGEGMIGWAVLPALDIQGGIRFDNVTISGFGLGGGFFDVSEFEFQGLAVGGNIHTPQNRPFGAYGAGRWYFGTGEFTDSPQAQYDTTGWRFEGGVVIPIGSSNWSAVPGVEREYLRIETGDFKLDTNRFFVNFVWTSGATR